QVDVSEDSPAAFAVDQNSPNPFNPTTSISFKLTEAGNVSVEVFNVAGQKIDTVANEFMSSGSHSVTWNASGFSAGIYFYTVKSGDFSRTMKMTLLK
ncbi:T9SS type A sorting domain-containing protein, partial [Candidatus Latescibacterota bacterium]